MCKSVLELLKAQTACLEEKEELDPGCALDVVRTKRLVAVFQDILKIKMKHLDRSKSRWILEHHGKLVRKHEESVTAPLGDSSSSGGKATLSER